MRQRRLPAVLRRRPEIGRKGWSAARADWPRTAQTAAVMPGLPARCLSSSGRPKCAVRVRSGKRGRARGGTHKNPDLRGGAARGTGATRDPSTTTMEEASTPTRACIARAFDGWARVSAREKKRTRGAVRSKKERRSDRKRSGRSPETRTEAPKPESGRLAPSVSAESARGAAAASEASAVGGYAHPELFLRIFT